MAGIIAAVLAIMMAIPMNFSAVEVNAEGNAGNSVEIVGGEIKSITYTILVKEQNDEKRYTYTIDDIDKSSYKFEEENVIKIELEYEMNAGYMLESVKRDGTFLNADQYTQNEDGTITYETKDNTFIGKITLRCIPKELTVSNLKATRVQNQDNIPTNTVGLSWNAPVIPEGSDYSLDEYRLIIRRTVEGETETIFNDIYPKTSDDAPVCAYEDSGIDDDASSTNATYTVSVVAEKAYKEKPEAPFYGTGVNVEWNAVYDLQLSVNGKGKVKIGEKEYASSDTPYTIYNIPYVTEEKTNLTLSIIPEDKYGVSSLLVNGTEEKKEIENNKYSMRMEESGDVQISFAPLADMPSLTTSSDKYTEIAENGTVEVTSAGTVDKTYYRYKGLEELKDQERWKEFPLSFEGASKTVKISAEELFGEENYAILRAYSSKKDCADSKVVENYYYRRPETPALTSVSFDNNYVAGKWTANNVTLKYNNTSKRVYAGLQIGYVLNGQGNMKWQDMNQQENGYSFNFTQSGEYSVALRFKMADPNHPGEFVYGETLTLTDNIKIDTATPKLAVSGYTSGAWSAEDVKMNLQNQTNQISGTTYYYAVSDEQVQNENLSWKACEAGNQVEISCDEDENLTKYVYMKATSNAGKESTVVPYIVKIDKKNPDAPTVSFSKVDGENGWYITFPEITMKQTKQDGGSQIATYYKIYQEGQDSNTAQEVLFDGKNQPIISKDGKYTFVCYAKDAAGNVSEVAEQELKVDTGAPNGPSIEFRTENDSVLAHIINFITFGYFCNEKVVAVVQSSDSMSQVEEYAVWYTQDGKDGEVSIIKGETAEIELPENFKGTVSAYAVDNAGNKSETSESDGIIYENIQSEITITADVDNNKWQNGDVNFQIITQDEQSGLRNVEYILNGKTVYQNDFTDSRYNDLVYMDQQQIQASEEAETSAGYVLQVKVTDNAGNKTEKSAVVYIDKTAPVIEFSGIANGAYSNATETLTVKVDEQIYDLNSVSVSATRTIDGVTTPYDMEGFASDSVNSKKNYTFSEDGTYVVTVNAVDAAGNTAIPKQISFTIDKSAPKIEVNGPQNDSYHASDVSVEVNVEESFFDTNTVTINVTKTLDGQTGNVEFGSWSNQGKNSSLSRTFSEDGTYLVEVQAKDAAGNQATAQQLTFTVDKTAPEVNINGAGDYFITGNNITLSYDVVESYFDTNNVNIQMQKEDAAGNVTDVNVGSWVNSGKESSLTYVVKEDGVYTTVITAVDKAGNEATARKTVTVDTSDPIIKHVDEMNGKYYQVFKLPYELSEMINDLTVPTISMYLNSDEYDGVSEVEEEGKYVFKMDVSDEVGHKAVAQAEFIVDNTEPKVVFNGIEDGMKYNEALEWSVSLTDAKDVMKEVTVDGEIQEFNAETNSYQGTLSKKGTHTIEVKAEDLAGNTTNKVISVEISEESVVDVWNNNKPLVVGGIAVAVGAAGVGAGYATGFFGKGAGKRLFKKRLIKK